MGTDDPRAPPRRAYRIADPGHPIDREAPTGTYVPFVEGETSDALPDSVLGELTDEVVDGLLRNLVGGVVIPDSDDHPTPPTTLARTLAPQLFSEITDSPDPLADRTPDTPQRVAEPEVAPTPPPPPSVPPASEPTSEERVPDLLDLFATPGAVARERAFPKVEALLPEHPAPNGPVTQELMAPVVAPRPAAQPEPRLPAPRRGWFQRLLATIAGWFGRPA